MILVSYLASMEMGDRLILCFVLKSDSRWGSSNKEGGPNGQAIANKAKSGSSLLPFLALASAAAAHAAAAAAAALILEFFPLF